MTESDIKSSKLPSIFPNIIEKTDRKENSLEFFIKVTDSINKKNEKRSKEAAKIFSYKKPVITYALIAICVIVFVMMYLFGNGSEDSMTLINFGANFDLLTKNGQYYRLFTCMFCILALSIYYVICIHYMLLVRR